MTNFAVEHRWSLPGFLAVAVILSTAALVSVGQFSVLGGEDTSPPIVSYCGAPDWLDQFNDQNGYTPAQQCTGVSIAGYRIDVSRDSYHDGWGCFSKYTVYNQTPDGLQKLTETGITDSHDHITVPGLTIKPQTSSRFSFYNCQYVGSEYRIETPGQVTFEATGDPTAVRGEPATVSVTLQNRFTQPVTGELTVDFCAPGPFAQEACVVRSKPVDLDGDTSRTTQFSMPTDRVHGNITVTPTLAGSVARPDGWTGVNWDCDGDGTIEPVSECSGFDLGSVTGDELTIQVGDPTPPTLGDNVSRWLANVFDAITGLLPGA